MQVGLLWFDKDPRIPFVQKVLEAAERYHEKFGAEANTCYVHPSLLPAGVTVPGFELRTRATILPHHFWVGFAEDAQPAPRITPIETAAPPVEEETRPRRKRRVA